MTYRLIDVGRGKYNGTVHVARESDLLHEVRRHLLSNDVSIEWHEGVGTIFAGFHAVGAVTRGDLN